MTLLPILLALASWSAPCADPGTCWIAWQWKIEKYEIWVGDTLCAELMGFRKQNGKWVNPSTVYQPRPGGGPNVPPNNNCWGLGESTLYKIRACTNGICGPFGEEIEMVGQDFMCFNHLQQIPCED